MSTVEWFTSGIVIRYSPRVVAERTAERPRCMPAMRPGEWSTSSDEHQETRGPEARPGCRNDVRQNVLGILDRSYVHRPPRSGVNQTALVNTKGTAMRNLRR